MEVSCPACSSRYLVSDDRVRGKTARMRCKNCQTVWMVTGPMGGADLSATGGRAAVIRRGAEREHRDLFATRPPDQGSVKQTMRPPAPNYGFSTAGRNENSVLFSVDELKRAAGARVQTPEPVQVAPSGPQDDSGVIDLKALSHAPPPPAGPLTPPMLFSEPPPGAFAVDATGPNPGATNASSKWIALTGIAAAAILLLGVGVAALAFRGAEPVNRLAAAPPATVATVAAAAPITPPAVASDSSGDAKSPTTGEASSSDAKQGKKAKRGRGKWSRGRGRAAAKGKSAAKPKAAKAADPCHCKGDFTCILRCTAKGK